MDEKIEQAMALLRRASDEQGAGLAYPCSFGPEGSVLLDLMDKCGLAIPVMTLDTGRLPQATYDVIEASEKRYGIKVRVLFPDCAEVEAMVRQHGVNLFRQSLELRKRCCEVRKVHPLQRALSGYSAWITGRRREQSEGRAELSRIEKDAVYGLTKYNPLLDWSWKEIMLYLRQYAVPYNRLLDLHYHSIGCECCTRAITVGEDERAGRWWWEQGDAASECGLHVITPIAIDGRVKQGEGI